MIIHEDDCYLIKIKEENNKRKREIENKKMEAIKRRREYEQY